MSNNKDDRIVYLLHLDQPLSPDHTAQHYIGSTDDLARRLHEHRHGNGSRFMEVAAERGIGFKVVRTWLGDRHLERKLKNQHNAPRLCPVCNPPAF